MQSWPIGGAITEVFGLLLRIGDSLEAVVSYGYQTRMVTMGDSLVMGGSINWGW